MIRPAVADDVAGIAELAQRKREQYETYQPRFWRVAVNAIERHTPFVSHLVSSDDWITLVSREGPTLTGFVFASVRPAPSVYDPGGLTAMVDDFAVASDALWATVGVELLEAVKRQAAQRGASQIVVVCGHRDEAKRTGLGAAGLSLASEWYVGETGGIAANEI